MGEDFDWASMINHSEDLNPTVTAGPFKFNRLEAGTAIYLEANPDYPAPTNGTGVMPEGYVFLDTPDENVMIERFLAGGEGEPNFLREPATTAPILAAADAGDVEALSAPGRVWHYVALNTADPNNPMNAYDEAGNLIPREEQGYHPLFGDVRVRQALQHAINIDEIIQGVFEGNATPMVAGTIPSAFTLHPELERRPFDLDAARALLDEAGFPATGEPLCDGCDGLRVANEDALYAEPGTEFYFELMNVGDKRNDVSVILQDQFAQIGVEVEVVVLDFNAMYDDNMGAQTFDAAVAGWRGELPFNPDQTSLFGSHVDIFGEGYGFNFGSWYNAEFEELGNQVNAVEGCDETARKEIAYRMQEIMYEEQPYLWLYALNSLYAANGIENFDPKPNFGNWNSDAWLVTQ
jgi:peptide/nickel transport system substrate-binding protein